VPPIKPTHFKSGTVSFDESILALGALSQPIDVLRTLWAVFMLLKGEFVLGTGIVTCC